MISETEALLSIIEGRYHQVRRMFAATGNHVEALHREELGGLSLPEDLAAGQWTLLSEDEIALIFQEAPNADQPRLRGCGEEMAQHGNRSK